MIRSSISDIMLDWESIINKIENLDWSQRLIIERLIIKSQYLLDAIQSFLENVKRCEKRIFQYLV